eukprot:TRINITY_DN48500_c0_g1_i1.p1 TRINITY_DN48500_c0_g1~~TRINITY_DN48500_c0_g1_i1.p1  ORF type:complete len:377 (+),score=55.89 TRINITY_DN48500_c0_g1_i1:74-1132(+)
MGALPGRNESPLPPPGGGNAEDCGGQGCGSDGNKGAQHSLESTHVASPSEGNLFDREGDRWKKQLICCRLLLGSRVASRLFISVGERAVQCSIDSNNDRDVRFNRRVLVEKARAWTNKRYSYHRVPSEMKGAILFAGPMLVTAKGTLTVTSPKTHGVVFVWCELGSRSGSIPFDGWEEIGLMFWKWGRGAFRKMIPLKIHRRLIGVGGCVELPVRTSWVGGVAFLEGRGPPPVPWDPPPFLMMSGEAVPPWDADGVTSVAELRVRLAAALEKPAWCVQLISSTSMVPLRNEVDELPDLSDGLVFVVVNSSPCLRPTDFRTKIAISKTSADVARAVHADRGHDVGAGDRCGSI